MKTISKSLCYMLAAILMLIANFPSYAGGTKPSIATNNDIRYAVLVNKNQNSKKHKIRLYTDAGQDKLLFTVNGVEGKKYELFVFDMESRLVSQANIHNRETSVLNNIPKGNYLFQVLVNDEQVESGQLTIK